MERHDSMDLPKPDKKTWKRKNWFVSASVVQPPSKARTFRESDLCFEVYRAAGPGGQHVSKTNSTVRVTHTNRYRFNIVIKHWERGNPVRVYRGMDFKCE